MDDRITARKVDVIVDETGKVWVNVDDVCVLRIGHALTVLMDDHQRGQAIVYQSGPYPCKMIKHVGDFCIYSSTWICGLVYYVPAVHEPLTCNECIRHFIYSEDH